MTHHCCELVELGPQVGAPEVDVGGFVPHLVTVGTEWPVRGWAGLRDREGLGSKEREGTREGATERKPEWLKGRKVERKKRKWTVMADTERDRC